MYTMKKEYLLAIAVIAIGGFLLLRGRKGEGVQLQAGDNEVVYMGATRSPEVAMAPIEQYLDIIWHYDEVDGWTSWAPVFAGDLTTVVYGEPYWVKVNQDCFWSW